MTEKAFCLRRTHILAAGRFLAILQIQDKTTSIAGIQKWGFSELQTRLNALPENSNLRVDEFDVGELAIRCVFDSDSSTLLGCTIVQKRRKAMQTPPDWDGSLETLERFNKPAQQ
ncbi:hypothetical protein GM672_26615 [Massilia buxea]|uniref:Uncharacterized protein n=1 Tax=Pseudoduganella buxea TaxID=1949069 RepID=A0A6I3T4D6_9BURK|nr:hypothetical protein [Pseudoduganella buxea]